MTLQQKAKQLIELKTKADVAQKKLNDALEAIEPLRIALSAIDDEMKPLREDMLAHLKKSKQFSVRFDEATVTRTVRKNLKVIDQKVLIAYLKERGMTEYFEETINPLFTSLKKSALAEGIVLPGTELDENEFITLKINTDEEKDRRRVIKGDFVPHHD